MCPPYPVTEYDIQVISLILIYYNNKYVEIWRDKKTNTPSHLPSTIFKNLIFIDSIALQPSICYILSLMLVTYLSLFVTKWL